MWNSTFTCLCHAELTVKGVMGCVGRGGQCGPAYWCCEGYNCQQVGGSIWDVFTWKCVHWETQTI